MLGSNVVVAVRYAVALQAERRDQIVGISWTEPAFIVIMACGDQAHPTVRAYSLLS